MQLIGVNIVPPRDLADHCVRHLAFLDDPKLLSRRPAPAPLQTGKDRDRHRVCPSTPKLMGQRSHTHRRFGRWPLPDAYVHSDRLAEPPASPHVIDGLSVLALFDQAGHSEPVDDGLEVGGILVGQHPAAMLQGIVGVDSERIAPLLAQSSNRPIWP